MLRRQNAGGKRARGIVRIGQCVVPVAAALCWGVRVDAANSTWTGMGDGTSWTNSNNWTALPPNTTPGDNLFFGSGSTATIALLGNELGNSLTFSKGFTLDLPGATDTLTITTGSVSVGSGVSATINALIAGTAGLTLGGGGTVLAGRGDDQRRFGGGR
jgi:fibronectin-binding autotransporter adhesin